MKSAAETRVLEVLKKYQRHLNPAWSRLFQFAALETLAIEAEGAVIRDVYGREYLDFAASVAVFILGHRHPRVLAAVRRELERMPLSAKFMPEEPMAELASMLAEATPGDLQFCFFCHSGAEANEGALKLARLATGKPGFIAASGAFHGKTFGALSVSGSEMYRAPFQPLLPGVTHVPFGDAKALEAAITEDTAAVILEPIQGENGVIVPPTGYLRGVRDVCTRAGVLLIVDEVQTGMGRTGMLWACEWEGVAPDILTAAKGLGGGVTTLGAFIATPTVYEPLTHDPYLHSTTIGNRLAWVAAIETLRTIREEGLLERARQIGDRLLRGLQEVMRRHPSLITDVRGKGCLVGVEFPNDDVGILANMGLITRQVLAIQTLNRRQVVRFAPPLIATDAQVDRAVEAMAETASEVESLVEEAQAAT
jgi:putrescine aminotransferase